jgi:hypothetical protein
MARSPHIDDPRARRSPHQPKGHPPGPERPLGFAVLPQQSLDRGCDPRCLAGAHVPSLERLERLRDPQFCRRSCALSRETLASSPACLRLSSARRSSVCAPLTEGERTDAVASCWQRDGCDLDLVEPECAMPSSRSTSSHHCFMALGEALELGGWRSNSQAADNAPGAAFDGVRDDCAVVCCCAACTTAVPDTRRLGTCGME